MTHEIYIKKCLELAKKGEGKVSPNPMVGCVIVKKDEIISGGFHHEYGSKHAEIDALDKIAGKAKGASLYVNLEPCSHQGKTAPCAERIIKEGIKEVIIGTKDPNPIVNGRGIKLLKKANIKVSFGILEEECRELNETFFYFHEKQSSFVFLKIALSKDFFLTPKDKRRVTHTNQYSMKITHKWRSLFDAILVSTGTVKNDNPKLTVREIEGRQPLRLILDREKKLDLAKYFVFNDEFKSKTIIFTSKKYKNELYSEYLEKNKIRLIEVKEKNNLLDLKDIFKKTKALGISSILVEGGVELTKNILQEKFVNRIAILIGTKEIGAGFSPFKSRNLEDLKKELKLKNVEIKNIAGDTLLIGELEN